MFVRLYNDYLLKEEEIIGIFDLDSATEMPTSRRFLREAEAKGKMRVAAKNIPRSFIVSESAVYLSHASASSLIKSLHEA
jgi:hypothetical protein